MSLRYLSENSLFTILELFSICEIIESVILSFVPLGITKSIDIRSEAIEGKKAVLIIPPPKEPKVSKSVQIKIDITKKRLFNENFKKGS